MSLLNAVILLSISDYSSTLCIVFFKVDRAFFAPLGIQEEHREQMKGAALSDRLRIIKTNDGTMLSKFQGGVLKLLDEGYINQSGTSMQKMSSS